MKRIIVCTAFFLSLYACKDRTATVNIPTKKETTATPPQPENKTTSPATITSPTDDPGFIEPISAGNWSENEKAAFVNECVKAAMTMGKQKANDYCNCMMGKMQAKSPDIRDAEKIKKDELMELAKECLK